MYDVPSHSVLEVFGRFEAGAFFGSNFHLDAWFLEATGRQAGWC